MSDYQPEKRFGFRDYARNFAAKLAFVGILFFPALGMSASIPYIDCSGDNSAPPESGRVNESIIVSIPVSTSKKLSFFAGAFSGALAPRGWRCFEQDGGDGGILSIYPPGEYNAGGPLVEVSEVSSIAEDGADDTQAYVCRYFSKTKYNEWHVCKDGVYYPPSSAEPASYINPVPEFVSDQLIYLNPFMIQYTTPPNSVGLGTSGLFDPTEGHEPGPILRPLYATSGFLVVGKFSGGRNVDADGIMELFKVRLPENKDDIRSAIMSFERECYNKGDHGICTVNDVDQAR